MNPAGSVAVTCTGESDGDRATPRARVSPFSVAEQHPTVVRPPTRDRGSPVRTARCRSAPPCRLETAEQMRPSVTYGQLADLRDPPVVGVGQGDAPHELAAGVVLQHAVAHRHPHRAGRARRSGPPDPTPVGSGVDGGSPWREMRLRNVSGTRPSVGVVVLGERPTGRPRPRRTTGCRRQERHDCRRRVAPSMRTIVRRCNALECRGRTLATDSPVAPTSTGGRSRGTDRDRAATRVGVTACARVVVDRRRRR